MLRRSKEKRWLNGVLSGGIVIDMLEYLSTTARTIDYSLVFWLQTHYVEPFGRIERLDGLIVTDEEDLQLLHIAYERYIEVQGDLARKEGLFVPGLEAVTFELHYDIKSVPEPPRNNENKPWRASDMHFNNGIEVKRKGQDQGYWKDTKNWDRWLWGAPGVEIEERTPVPLDKVSEFYTVENDPKKEEGDQIPELYPGSPASDQSVTAVETPFSRTVTPGSTMDSRTKSPSTGAVSSRTEQGSSPPSSISSESTF